MSIFHTVIACVFSFFIGIGFCLRALKWVKDKNDHKESLRVNTIFTNVISNLKKKTVDFTNRQGNITYLTTKLEGLGKVNILYLMDKHDIVIQKQKTDKFVISHHANKSIINDLIDLINIKFNREINDVIEVNGYKISRVAIERQVSKMNLSEMFGQGDMEKIKQDNQERFDLDSILDKINQVGLKNLTDGEKNYLNSLHDGKS